MPTLGTFDEQSSIRVGRATLKVERMPLGDAPPAPAKRLHSGRAVDESLLSFGLAFVRIGKMRVYQGFIIHGPDTRTVNETDVILTEGTNFIIVEYNMTTVATSNQVITLSSRPSSASDVHFTVLAEFSYKSSKDKVSLVRREWQGGNIDLTAYLHPG